MYDAGGIESQLITAQTRAVCGFACVSSRGHGINEISVNAVFLFFNQASQSQVPLLTPAFTLYP